MGKRGQGHRDSTRPPEQLIDRGRELQLCFQGWIPWALLLPGSSRPALLGYSWRGVCSEPQILKQTPPPIQLDPTSSPAELPELLQGAWTNTRGVGHGAVTPQGTLRGSQDSRGEVAPARAEQLMVPKPSHGDTAGRNSRILPQGQAPPALRIVKTRSCGWEEPWEPLVPAGPGFPAPATAPAPAPALSLPW